MDSNTHWTWNASESWVTSSIPTDPNGSLTFTYTVAPNSEKTSRVATITLTYGLNTVTHTITQLAHNPITPPDPPQTPPGTDPVVTSATTVGSYAGILTSVDATQVHGHLKSLRVQSSGAFTGSLYFEKVTYSLSGTFDASGHFVGTFSPAGVPPVSIDFQLAKTTTSTSTNNPNIQVVGTATAGGTTGHLRAIRASTYTRSYGFYTFLILPDKLDTTAPQAYGYGTVSISGTAGAPISLSGVLPDGTSWSSSGNYISPENELPFFASLYGGTGSIAGMIQFNSKTNVSDFSSQVVWSKSQSFNYQRTMMGSRYIYYDKPNPRAIDLADTNPNAEFALGADPLNESWTIEWTAGNAVVHHGAANLNLGVNIGNGSFSGSVPKNGGGSWSIRGVILQEQNLVAGLATSIGEDPQPFVLSSLTPTTVQEWLAANNQSSQKDLNQDLNGDGVTLLMAYALNLDSRQFNAVNLPQPQQANGDLSLTYYGLRPDINYQVETSVDLRNWAQPTSITYSAPDANGLVTANVTVPPGGFLYIRLVVSMK